MIFDNSGRRFYVAPFKDEKEVEAAVFKHYKHLYGDYSILLEKKTIKTAGASTIPDGFVVDFEKKCWYIVEVERSVHDAWGHIFNQIAKQSAAAKTIETKHVIKDLCLDSIYENVEFKQLLIDFGLNDKQIRKRLEEILEKDPIVSLPIDDQIPDALVKAIAELKAEVRIRLIERYVDSNGTYMYDFPGLEDDQEKEFLGSNAAKNHLAILVKAHVLNQGQKVSFKYAPKGMDKKTFEGVIREYGIEIENKVMSPSDAALYCIRTLAPSRTTANGWVTWKTDDGALLDDLWNTYLKKGGFKSVKEKNQKKSERKKPESFVKKTEPKTTTSKKTNELSAIIDKGLLHIGEKVWFMYGPKGKTKQKFLGIVREEGIEVFGSVYSVSAAAVKCTQTLNPKCTSWNGWTAWFTEDGKSLDELRKKYNHFKKV